MTRRLTCPMCRSREVVDYTCQKCGYVDTKMKKMHEALKDE